MNNNLILEYLSLKIERIHEEITKFQRRMRSKTGTLTISELELLKNYIIRIKELNKLKEYIKKDRLEEVIEKLKQHKKNCK